MTRPLAAAIVFMLPFVLGGVALSFPISIGLLRIFRRAVRRSMHARPNGIPVETDSEAFRSANQGASHLHASAAAQATTPAIYLSLLRLPWRAAIVHAFAGVG